MSRSGRGWPAFVTKSNSCVGPPPARLATWVTPGSSAATRANTTAGVAQAANLNTDETLTINGVAVNLTAGQSQAQVVATINGTQTTVIVNPETGQITGG